MSAGLPRACSGDMYPGVPTGPGASICAIFPDAGRVRVRRASPQSIR